MKAKILVTGCAGFIGSKTVEFLLARGKDVVGIDNFNDAYDVRIKKYRLRQLKKSKKFIFHKSDIENEHALNRIFKENQFFAVINLAARAGVRYSVENPYVYINTNVMGCLNLLECSRKHGVENVVVASTSSLYQNQGRPFKEGVTPDMSPSPYAASKKGAEALCQSYAHLYGMNVTVLRYFTVYGPAGRPDMSPFRFIHWIDSDQPVQVTGDGTQSRDFTYVDDIADGTIKALSLSGFHLINLGGSKPHALNELIRLIEKYTGKKANIKYFPVNRADAKTTWADNSDAQKKLKWSPSVSLEAGIQKTVEWHRNEKKMLDKIKL